MKQDYLISFMAGIVAGTVLGVLVGDKDKKRIQQILNRQAERLRKEYESPIRESAEKVKDFVKAQLQ